MPAGAADHLLPDYSVDMLPRSDEAWHGHAVASCLPDALVQHTNHQHGHQPSLPSDQDLQYKENIPYQPQGLSIQIPSAAEHNPFRQPPSGCDVHQGIQQPFVSEQHNPAQHVAYPATQHEDLPADTAEHCSQHGHQHQQAASHWQPRTANWAPSMQLSSEQTTGQQDLTSPSYDSAQAHATQDSPHAAADTNSKHTDTARQGSRPAGASQQPDIRLAETSVACPDVEQHAATMLPANTECLAKSSGSQALPGSEAQPGPTSQETLSQAKGTAENQVPHSAVPEADAEEEFDQDVMSQPPTSEEDEDFEPDYLSQPDSTTDDAFEVDEAMSQPSDTESEDLDAKAQEAARQFHRPASGLAIHGKPDHATPAVQKCRSQVSVAQTQKQSEQLQQTASGLPTHGKHQGATPAAADQSMPVQGSAARLRVAVQSGSGRQGSKRASRHTGSEDLQVPAAKRHNTSPAWEQGPQRRALLLSATHHRLAEPQHQPLQHQPAAAATAASTPQVQHQNAASPADADTFAAGPDQHSHDHAQMQPPAAADTAPVSFRKRPRKAARPKCSGPVFCTLPEPPDSPPITKGREKCKSTQPAAPAALPKTQHLRPQQDSVGKWGAKGSRQPRKPKHKVECQKVVQHGKVPSAVAGDTDAENAPGTCDEGVMNPVDRPQNGLQDAASVSGVVPVSVSEMLVDGVHTVWSDEQDRAVLLVCVIQHQGHPSLEVLNQLVNNLEQLGAHFTVRQVQARFQLLLQRFLHNSRQQS